MSKSIKLLFFAKTADGGPGTFLLSMQKLPKFFDTKIEIRTLVLKKPVFRVITKQKFMYFKNDPDLYTSIYKLRPVYVLDFISEFLWFYKNTKEYAPTVVLSMDAHCNLITVLYKIFFASSLKIILTTHIDVIEAVKAKSSKFVGKCILFLISKLYNHANSIICISKSTSVSFKKVLKINKNIKTIYYGLTFPTPSVDKKDDKKKIILSIGRLDEQKDFETLILSVKPLIEKNRNIELQIIGDGPLKKNLNKLINDLSLIDNIKLFGWKQNVYPFINKADIFVLTTKREGFGYVLIEAMSQRVPVISSDVPFGPSEILGKGKYGILVHPKNIVELTRKINKLLSNKTFRKSMSEKAFQRSKYFSEEKMLLEYVNEIKKVMNI